MARRRSGRSRTGPGGTAPPGWASTAPRWSTAPSRQCRRARRSSPGPAGVLGGEEVAEPRTPPPPRGASASAPASAGTVATVGTPAPPAVRLVSIRKRYGKVDAVDGVDLTIAEGEFFTLLGPSGSGKTTLLRLIAGFERPDEGYVELRGDDVTLRPPYARDVNTVFQDYALFPHMTVADNIEYGLRVKRVPRAERHERVAQVLATVRLGGLGDRKPTQLSGGQRQRVALARAIVNQPEVLLLDEPLGALDLKLRQEMQLELKRIQEQVGITFLYVTHDQEEALTMSDRVAILRDGRVEQVGTPVEVYERPASDFVAGFIGVSNLIERDGRHVTVRPEKIRILDDTEQSEPGAHVESGVVREVIYLGAVTRYVVDLEAAGQLVVVRQNLDSAEQALQARGRRVRLAWQQDQAARALHPRSGTPGARRGTRAGRERLRRRFLDQHLWRGDDQAEPADQHRARRGPAQPGRVGGLRATGLDQAVRAADRL